MRRALLVMTLLCACAGGSARAAASADNPRLIRDCIMSAAVGYRIPAPILVVLLNVERGKIGRVSPNTNGTVDIGPMQVNQIWLPELAAHWNTSIANAYPTLRDNFCANVEAGAWILRRGLDEAHGNFWDGVGYYHSHDPHHRAVYLQAVLTQVLRLQSRAAPAAAVTSLPRTANPAPPLPATMALRN